MLRVTIEMLPHGIEERKKHLGTVTIANDGTGTETKGNYSVRLTTTDGKRIWKTGKVKGFSRKRFGAYDLLMQALVVTCASRLIGSKTEGEGE